MDPRADGNYHLIVKPTGEKRYLVAKGPDVLAGTDLALGTTLAMCSCSLA